jgi:translation initiation factor IF-3
LRKGPRKQAERGPQVRINSQIRARELRVVLDDGGTMGVVTVEEALKEAQRQGLDLIEISPQAKPPVAKITDYGKFQYEYKKKAKVAKQKAHSTETKVLQVKIATGEHDLQLKAKRATQWLQEGHRVKIDLFLVGRAKYSGDDFKKKRLDRIFEYIQEGFKVADPPKRSPKGFTVVIERDKSAQKQEQKQHEDKQVTDKENKDNKDGQDARA